MGSSLLRSFKRALSDALAHLPLATNDGSVERKTEPLVLGSPSGAFEPRRMWRYRRRISPHAMTFGFVPYAGAEGLFCVVRHAEDDVRDGEGASLQLRLDQQPGLEKIGGKIVVGHSGRPRPHHDHGPNVGSVTKTH